METAKSPVESGLLIIIVSETNKNETKEQKDIFGILLGAKCESLLGNL